MTEQRLIDANARIEEIRKVYCINCDNYDGVRCRSCWVDDGIGFLEDAPTVDAVEVVHGRWEKCWQEISKHYFRCSSCHTAYMDGVSGAISPEYGSRAWRYCPNCGAKMDGGNEDGC